MNEPAERALRRAFVALEPSGDALDHVERAVGSLPGNQGGDGLELRRTPRTQWHVTLQFLGPVAHAAPLVDALRTGVAAVRPFTVQLGGGGAFSRARAGTVLWFGVTAGAEAMTALAGAVVRATATVGVAAEERPFRPHLTVARAARPRDLRPAVAALGGAGAGPEWTASEIVLFESETRAEGAVHSVVARVPLGLLDPPGSAS